MVKTRAQKQVADADAEKSRSIPGSALPPKVCCTPPPGKRPPAISSKQSKSVKKKRLAFAPEAPEEFKFDLCSPPVRRLHHASNGLVHDSVVRIEFESRASEDPLPAEIGDREREKYKEWIIKDLKQELRVMHGIDCDHVENDVQGLRERLELAQMLRRRAEVRRAPQFTFMPHEMNLKDIQRELHSRRISFSNLTHYQATEALERALLKEDSEGLIGEGYQFGRRLVSASDVISFYQPSDKEMRDMLQSRALKSSMIPKKKAQKLELLSKFVEVEQEELMRRLIQEELVKELNRRHISHDSAHYHDMFETLYLSGKWKLNYDDVDNTPYLPEPDENTSGCIIS